MASDAFDICLAGYGEDSGRIGIQIRPFERRYEAAARDLFVRCIREIAPPSLGAHLDAYVAAALEGDYRDIASHYRPGRGRGFWTALSPADDLLGTFALRPCRGDAVELRRMYVDGAARRRGIASAMLKRAEADAAHQGFGSLLLTTSSLNHAAIQLYRRAGYRQSEYAPPDGVAEPLPPGLRIFAFEKSLGAV